MPSQSVIGVLHPGEMGAAVGRCLTGVAAEVLWASEGRGPETAARARAAGLTDAGTAAEIAERADVILSICPPHAALDVAWAVQGFGGLFVDANAISPATAREVALMVEEGGATYVDGGIIGQPPPPPPSRRARPACTCPAPEAGAVRALFDGTFLDARVVTGGTWSRVHGQDGLRGVDQGHGGAAAHGAGAGQVRGRGGDAARRVGAVPACARATGPTAPPRPRPRRAGAGWPRWRKSPPAWPPPACPTGSTRPRPRSSAARRGTIRTHPQARPWTGCSRPSPARPIRG